MQDGDETIEDVALRDKMLRLLLGGDVAAALAGIAEVADFEILQAENRPFVEFSQWIGTRPAFIAAWRADPESEQRHYLRFMTGFDACRAGYAASVYHLGRLRAIEDAIHDVLARYNFAKSFRPGAVGALGSTRRWDFEYQAFVLAYRRSLDALAWGLSTYFKAEQSSFPRFAKALPRLHPTPVAIALGAACTRHIGTLDLVIDPLRGRSVRDRIAHREAVAAGVINVGTFGHRVLGGGEQLGLSDPGNPRRLADSLQSRLAALHACIGGALTAFRSAVTDYEGGAASSAETGSPSPSAMSPPSPPASDPGGKCAS